MSASPFPSDRLASGPRHAAPNRRLTRRTLIIASAAAAGAHALHLSAAPARQADDLAWWQKGVIYEVYPRSFQDSDGDGVGDLAGIASRLDYLAALGVDIVWIAPTYPSPMADFGYDVSDYTGVDPLFGSLDDMDTLIARAHELGMKVVLDWVANHTSDQHPWFIESRSSRDNPKHDWYIWKDPAENGAEPNNWTSAFDASASAWEWDDTREQYYYHAFLKEQPDLNWRNPDVVAAMHDTLRFWLDRGVDGFRMDAFSTLLEDEQLRDNLFGVNFMDVSNTNDVPGVVEIAQGIREVLDEYDDRAMIAEVYIPIENRMAYYGTATEPAFHLVFNFGLITELPAWIASAIGVYVADYDTAIPENGWPMWVLGNHDQSRIASRIGPDQAPLAALLLLALRGTPTMYYGDEIGIVDGQIPQDRVQDPLGITYPGYGRDPERTPMQWDATEGAGFTEGEPWLPLSGETGSLTVEAQQDDPDSLLSLYRRLLALRRERPALHGGAYREVLRKGTVLAWERAYGNDQLIVVLNINAGEATVSIPEIDGGQIVLGTDRSREGQVVGADLPLAGNEGIIVDLSAAPGATPAR